MFSLCLPAVGSLDFLCACLSLHVIPATDRQLVKSVSVARVGRSLPITLNTGWAVIKKMDGLDRIL